MRFGKFSDHCFGQKKVTHEPLMTASELARMKGYSRQHISYRLKSCTLEFTEIHSKKYYKRSELLNWFNSEKWEK